MNYKAIIEAILFAWGDPVKVSDLAKILEITESETNLIIDEMEMEFKFENRGLRIIRINDSIQISTKPELYSYINNFIKDKKKKNLSNAALETLSIIAYKQPVTKLEIEEIRGVKCDGTIKLLNDLNFIEEKGRLDRIGKPIIYGTTNDFLKKFGLEKIEDLPKIDESFEEISFLEEK